MSQRSIGETYSLPFTAPVALTGNDFVPVWDVLGTLEDTVSARERATLQLCHAVSSARVLQKEGWAPGQRLYYNEAAEVITREVTEWPVGWAYYAKEGGDNGHTVGALALDRALRSDHQVIYTLNMATFPANQGLIGDSLLRSFGDDRALIRAARLYRSSDLNPTTTTVSLGNGTGDNDQIRAAVALSTLAADREHVFTVAVGTLVNEVVLRLDAAPLTAGWLRVDIDYVLHK